VFVGDPSDAEVREVSTWLVRVIVSLLTMPGEDEDAERSMIERFVVPAVPGR